MDGKKEVTPEDAFLLFYGNCFYPLGDPSKEKQPWEWGDKEW